jgi:hypothetical protein
VIYDSEEYMQNNNQKQHDQCLPFTTARSFCLLLCLIVCVFVHVLLVEASQTHRCNAKLLSKRHSLAVDIWLYNTHYKTLITLTIYNMLHTTQQLL